MKKFLTVAVLAGVVALAAACPARAHGVPAGGSFAMVHGRVVFVRGVAPQLGYGAGFNSFGAFADPCVGAGFAPQFGYGAGFNSLDAGYGAFGINPFFGARFGGFRERDAFRGHERGGDRPGERRRK